MLSMLKMLSMLSCATTPENNGSMEKCFSSDAMRCEAGFGTSVFFKGRLRGKRLNFSFRLHRGLCMSKERGDLSLQLGDRGL